MSSKVKISNSRTFGVVMLAIIGLAGGAEVWGAPFAYITNSGDGTVSVIDTATGAVAATVVVGGSPVGVTVHPSGNPVYIGNPGDNTVSVIDTTAFDIIATTPVGASPRGMEVLPDGAAVYIANFLDGTVSVIDTATNTVTDTIDVGGGILFGADVHPDGSFVYVTQSLSDFDNFLVVIDTATHEVVDSVPVGNSPEGLAVDPAGNKVYVVSAAGENLWVVDTATNTVTTTVNLFPLVTNTPRHAAVHPTGSLLYIVTDDSVVELDTVNYTPVNVSSGTFLNQGIDVHPAGTFIYAMDVVNNDVLAFETLDKTLTTLAPVGAGPQSYGRFVGPANVGAAVTGVALGKVVCHNLTTGQAVRIRLEDGNAWDCQAAGLVSGAGDNIGIRANGTAVLPGSDEGLLAYYPFRGDGRDFSANGDDATAVGAILAAGRWGVDQRAYAFDGETNFMSTAVDVNSAVSPVLTLAAWVYPRRTGGDVFFGRRQILSHDDGNFDRSLLMEEDRWRVFAGGGVTFTPGVAVDVGTWQHVVAVFEETDVKFYKNGVMYSLGAAPGVSESANTLTIGENPGPWDEFFDGIIDEVRVYGRALTEEDVRQLYLLGPAYVGGMATHAQPHHVMCHNLTTGQFVPLTVPEGAIAWDCEAAGLAALPGDNIEMRLSASVE